MIGSYSYYPGIAVFSLAIRVNQNKTLIKGLLCCGILVLLISSCFASPCPPEDLARSPTVTPSIPSRTLRSQHDFPWKESWRLETHLFDAYQNIRNLIAVGEGVVLTDNPTLTGEGDWLKFVNAVDGSLRWAIRINGNVESMDSDENLVYTVGWQNCQIIVAAYKLQTGELVWKSEITLPGHTGYTIQTREKGVYVYAYPGNQIYIFNAESGKLINQVKAGFSENSFVLFQLENEDVLQSKDKLLMLTKGNKVVWQTYLSAFPEKLPKIYGNIFIVKFQETDVPTFRGLAGVNLSTGEIIWGRPGEFYSNFVITDNLLYVVSKEAKIVILNPKSGQTIGTAELLPNKVDTTHPISAIAVSKNMLYVYLFDSQELIAFEKLNN